MGGRGAAGSHTYPTSRWQGGAKGCSGWETGGLGGDFGLLGGVGGVRGIAVEGGIRGGLAEWSDRRALRLEQLSQGGFRYGRFGSVLSFDDECWNHLTGGYKIPFDPRPCLQKLESRQDIASAWKELWKDLHHQGDVGDASYAAVPELVRIHRDENAADWNLYAIVATIELARTESRNPEVPNWLREDYFRAIEELARMGAIDIFTATETETQRAILSVIAIERDLRTHGKILVACSGEELMEIEPSW